MTDTTREAAVTEQRPRRRRRGGLLPLLLVALLLLLAVAVVGDRVAARLATNELRAQLVAELSRQNVGYASLDVVIGGFPFLTQVARGSYDEIRIDLSEVELPASTGLDGVVLPELGVVAASVDADAAELVEGTASVTAQRVTGTAVVLFQTLESLVDYSRYGLANVSFAELDGALRLTADATVFGIVVPISATGDITVADGQLQLRLRDATAVNVPATPAARPFLSELVERSLTAQLPPLPFGLALDDVDVASDGLAITAIGRDVALVE